MTDAIERIKATSDVLADIGDERHRQFEEEGYDYAHDDGHVDGEMAQAAACFALPHSWTTHGGEETRRDIWPWAYTPTLLRDPYPARRRDELVRAGALIVAEIERLDRRAASTT